MARFYFPYKPILLEPKCYLTNAYLIFYIDLILIFLLGKSREAEAVSASRPSSQGVEVIPINLTL